MNAVVDEKLEQIREFLADFYDEAAGKHRLEKLSLETKLYRYKEQIEKFVLINAQKAIEHEDGVYFAVRKDAFEKALEIFDDIFGR